MSFLSALSTGFGIANSAASLFDGITGSSSKRQYKYENKLQASQQDFLERMSNTAYQRQRADLDAAGYNPILALSSGGASTPSSGMGSVGMQSVGDSDGVSSAAKLKIDREIANKQIESLQSGIDRNEAEADKASADADLARAQSLSVGYHNSNSAMDLFKRRFLYDLELEEDSALRQTRIVDANFDNSTLGLILRGIGKASSAVSPLVNSAAALRSSGRSNVYSHSTNAQTLQNVFMK